MKKITKVLSVLMAAVMLMTALCVPVSAADEFEKAKLVNSGSKVSFELKATKYESDGRTSPGGTGIPKYFKVELSKKGTLKLDIISATSNVHIQVMDEEGAELFRPSKIVETTGNVLDQPSKKCEIYWDSSIKKSKCTLSYALDKGTYYVKAYLGMYATVKGKTSVSFTYPQDKSESSDSAKITSFTITLKKGSTLQLGTILSGEGTVKWSTSKKSVATVTSKGKVTAKAKGTAVITAKTGDSSMKITIKVTE